jgi:hypothetical protein
LMRRTRSPCCARAARGHAAGSQHIELAATSQRAGPLGSTAPQ